MTLTCSPSYAEFQIYSPEFLARYPELRLAIDPIYGIKYDITKVKFEKPSAKVLMLCSKHMDEMPSLYASYTYNGLTYYLTSGLSKGYDSNGNVTTDGKGHIGYGYGFGSLVVTDAGIKTCKYIASADVMSLKDTELKELKRLDLPMAVMDGLAADAFSRHVKAFGRIEILHEKIFSLRTHDDTSEAVKHAFAPALNFKPK